MSLALLYNPFTKIAGYEALVLGVVIHLLVTWLASLTGTHMIGYTDITLASDAPFWFFLAEMSAHAVITVLIIGTAGLVLAHSRFRWIDVMGTVLLSRAPLVLAPLVRLFPPFKSFFVLSPVFYLINLAFIIAVIWSIALLYHAFKVSCNPKSRFSTLGFIGAIILS